MTQWQRIGVGTAVWSTRLLATAVMLIAIGEAAHMAWAWNDERKRGIL